MFRIVLVASLVVCALGAAPRGLRKPRYDGRIVGGQEVDIADYPYQLSFQYSGRHICGASIISTTVALTAGHCADAVTAGSTTLRAGSSTQSHGGDVYQVARLTINPQYDTNTLDYDVAVAAIDGEIGLGANVATIGLASSIPADGTEVWVSGWGSTSSGGSVTNNLMAVSVPIYNQHECDRAYAQYGGVTARMFCAGRQEGGVDSCQGDSGGPVVSGGAQIGIVSWGVGCAEPGYPGVYSNVPALASWINQQL